MRSKRVLAFSADGTYVGYLNSHLFDASLYKRYLALCEPKKYPLLFRVLGIPIFIVSCLIGSLAQRGLKKLLLAARKTNKANTMYL